MPLLPLHGHANIRSRVDDAIGRDALPGALLLHGPPGVGKQRLALWIGQRLLCSGVDPRPCGICQHCRYALAGTHPDLHWYFPRPRLKDGDAPPAKTEDDFRDAIGERLKSGAYGPPPPEEGILMTTIRAIVHSAAMAPALAARKIYVVGDAERMVMRDGSEDSAGAFLKLLEEPPTRATIILTTSEPGALVATVRSRLVAVRVSALGPNDVEAVLVEPGMREAVAAAGAPSGMAARVALANGAPGTLLSGAQWGDALARARRVLEVATSGDRGEQSRTAFMQGSSKARGAFATSLDALTTLLHARMRAAAERGNAAGATGAGRAIGAVEQAKERATGNGNPQLITSELLRHLERYLT